jgi:diacylglycerol kinase family enzyme
LPIALILNTTSGLRPGGVDERELLELFRSVGMEPVVYRIERGVSIPCAVREALAHECTVVIAAGGDGTIGTVAEELVGRSIPLGVLPIGTLNHFARDAGIPLELPEAVRVIAEGHITNVDVGEVNGRFFINNSSIGFYPFMVSRRQSLQDRGVSKPIAAALAAITAFMRFPNLTVRVTAENSDLVVRTPLVFVGNNEYELAGPNAGRRARLQAGHMHVCIAKTGTRMGLLRMAVLALFGRMPAPPELETQRAKRVRVRPMRRRVRVALDGELVLMRSPLDYSIRPGALAVLTPRDREDQE